MLSIRLQRLGRKGHPVYRVVVQDSRQSPTSGKYVAMLGSYDPHTKTTAIAKDKAEFYLKNGAQPSERVVKLFSDENISLPKWVGKSVKQEKQIKNPDKLRKNRPAEEQKPAPEDAESEDSSNEGEQPSDEVVQEEGSKAETASSEADTADEDKEPEKNEAEPVQEQSQDTEEIEAASPEKEKSEKSETETAPAAKKD